MSSKIKDDIKKTGDKIVVKKNVTPKKATIKTKTETKKVQSSKKTGKVFKDKSIQTETPEEEKITAEDLMSNGKLYFINFLLKQTKTDKFHD